MKIRAIRGHFVDGRVIAPGEVSDLPEAIARALIVTGKAVEHIEPDAKAQPAPKAPDPKPEPAPEPKPRSFARRTKSDKDQEQDTHESISS